MPATRGQITRDLGQLTREENVTKAPKLGQPLRNISTAQDTRLHQLVDELRATTGAKEKTRQGLGKSVQGALLSKLRAAKASAKKAYDFANEIGATEYTTVKPLTEFLSDPINDANVGTDIRARLKAYSRPDGTISLKHLEDIRQEMTAASDVRDKASHYAGRAVGVIDQIFEDAGSAAYKNARQGWKALKDEFDKQGRIKKLVTKKGYSSDRATALEDTLDHVIKSPAEDIAKIRKSLNETPAGRQAWKDIQGGVLEHLREKATGVRRIPGQTGVPQFNSSFLDSYNELKADGKIDELFAPKQRRMLDELAKAIEDVRTKPSGRIAGSDTVPRINAMIEDTFDKVLGMVPIVGKPMAIGRQMFKEAKEGRAQTKRAVTSPLESAAEQARKGKVPTLRDLDAQ